MKKHSVPKFAEPEANAPKTARRVVIRKKRKTQKLPEELAGTGYEIPEMNMITPDVYELPNRKNFVNYIDDTFKSYKFKAGHKFTRSERFTFFNQQKLVRDYLQHDSQRIVIVSWFRRRQNLCIAIALKDLKVIER